MGLVTVVPHTEAQPGVHVASVSHALTFSSLMASSASSNLLQPNCSGFQNQITKLLWTVSKTRTSRICSFRYQVPRFLYMNSALSLIAWRLFWLNFCFSLCSEKVQCYFVFPKSYWRLLRHWQCLTCTKFKVIKIFEYLHTLLYSLVENHSYFSWVYLRIIHKRKVFILWMWGKETFIFSFSFV